MMTKSLLLSLVLIFQVLIVNSQPAPARYGKIDIADLQMKVYDKDTSAAAVILCDYGVFDPNNINFQRLLRIKILKKEGSDIVNRVFYITGTGMIKGCTYNLVDGVVVESKLKNESIFKEEVRDDYYRYRVTMPDVKVGSVVEISYGFDWLPSEWSFQQDVPVRWSELRIPVSTLVSIQKMFFGFEPYAISEQGRWATKDLPALHEEPYMSSMNNYLNRAEIELSSIDIPGHMRFFTTSWDAVNTYLNNNAHFGEAFTPGLFMSADVQLIKDKNIPEVEKMKEACEVIKRRVKWNEDESLYASDELGTAYKKGSGNSADINLLLVQMLKKLGFETFPVALSTRENGLISPSFPTIDKFNYVVAGVKLNDKFYLLDATEPNLPPGMLPFRALNGRGRIIDKEYSDWIDLAPMGEEKESIYCDVKLDETGEITGKLIYNENEYAGYYLRNDLKEHNSTDEHVKEIESSNPGLTVNSYTIENLDSINKPAREIFDVSLTGYADMIGDMISFSPMLIEKMESNPFKLETRKYPIDYGHCSKTRYVLNLMIPEGYEVVEMPAAINIALPNKSGRFSYNVSVNNNIIQMICNFDINKTLFLESEYQVVKEFYNQAIAKQAEVIMLKKKI